MAEKGLVTQIKEDLVVCTMTRKEACAKCRACIAGLSEKEMIIEAENLCDAVVGDWVEISLSEAGFMSAVLIMYGIPLIALMVGVLAGFYGIAPLLPGVKAEIVSFGLGIILTVIAYLWIHSKEDHWKEKKYRPEAIRVTSPPEPEEAN